ncbi:Uncharacterised protein [Vibrio cholerae]|nr:Uncharacterised protein [Vibrio cholerae]
MCSLSTGINSAPDCATASINSCPDMTNASLLASNTRLPAFTAAMVGNKPAAPTMAAITVSTSSSAATWHIASSPYSTSVAIAWFLSKPCNSDAADAVAITAYFGRHCWHSWYILATLTPATNATMENCCGFWAITLRVLAPIEPVAPKMVSLRIVKIAVIHIRLPKQPEY